MTINKTNYIALLEKHKKISELRDYFEQNIKDSRVSCEINRLRNVHVTITDKEGRLVGEYHFLNYNYFKTVNKKLKSDKIHIDDDTAHNLFIEYMTKTFPTYERDYLYELNEKGLDSQVDYQ